MIFIFDCVRLLYYKCHKVNFKRGESYIDSFDWIKSKKATTNPINKKRNKCFPYTVTVVLNHEQIKKDSQIITKVKLFIDKYNWEGINCSSKKDDWKKIEKNKLMIVLNVLYTKKERIFLLMFQSITQILKNKLFF